MKKFGLIAMAMALVITFSQCKKNDTTTPTNEGEKVFITLKVGNNSGSKVIVTPETGEVAFEENDVIHVASNGVYVGTLTYNGTQFVGNITEPTEGQKLHFYFLGNQTPEFSADNSQCSIIISDQTGKLPVISYNTSRENYQVGKTDYSATLLNKCALVKFNVTTSSTAATCIKGMNNKVTASFNPATEEERFGYNQDGEGVIAFAAGNGEKWALLLPQEEIASPEAFSFDQSYSGTCGTIQTIEENDYLTNGIAVVINTPMGAINGLFSVSATKQVYFSKGNLQFIGSATVPYWKFANNQWDYLGVTTGQNSDSEIVDRDLFGWGASGFDHGAIAYQPWATSTNYSHYYAYGNRQYHLYDQTGKADWGYNAIINGGNSLHIWRTLTKEEWEYLFNSRSSARYKYGHGQINEVNGIILLPDNWTFPEGLSFTSGNSDWANTYNITQWNQMEAAGAVFLPASGYRNEFDISNEEIGGYYWSSTNFNEYPADHARYLGFSSNSLHATFSDHRNRGYSVRLVQDY